jgi:hypothetical protein
VIKGSAVSRRIFVTGQLSQKLYAMRNVLLGIFGQTEAAINKILSPWHFWIGPCQEVLAEGVMKLSSTFNEGAI